MTIIKETRVQAILVDKAYPLDTTIMAALTLTEDGMMQLGLTANGLRYRPNPTAHQLKVQAQKFRTWFGVDPKTCVQIFSDIQEITGPAQIPKEKVNPLDLLMTVDWLRSYETDFRLSSRYRLDPSTASPILLKYTLAIQALKPKKIKWLDRWNNQDSEVIIVSVDGVHCRISEPRQMPSSKWYSHKENGPALAYEIAIAIHDNKVVHINGPFPAGIPDLSMYRNPSGLKEKMPVGKFATADRGYGGEKQLRLPNDKDTEIAKHFKKRSQARHETFNSRIKSFKILSSSFRHSHTLKGKDSVTVHDKHKAVFEAVCVILQYDMENGHPLFTV
jgi:hypothetical protein